MRINVNASMARADKKLQLLEKKLERQGELSVDEVAEYGRNFAALIAPRDSGKLISNIRHRKTDGTAALIRVQNYAVERKFGKGNYPDFDLVRWMHETDGKFKTPNPFGGVGTQHIKTGDPRFMFTTADELRSKFPNTVRRRLNKTIKIFNKR